MRRAGRDELAAGFVVGQLEVVGDAPGADLDRFYPGEIGALPEPARVEDVHVEDGAFTVGRAIVFQPQRQVAATGADLQLGVIAGQQGIGVDAEVLGSGQRLAVEERRGTDLGRQGQLQRLRVQRRIGVGGTAVHAVVHRVAQRIGKAGLGGAGGAVAVHVDADLQRGAGVVDAHCLVTLQLPRQALQEAAEVALLRLAPAGFGHCGQAREQVVLQALVIAGVLGEHVGLQAEDVLALVRGQFRRHRFEFVDLLQFGGGRAARRLVRGVGLQVVHVHVGDRGHHHVVAFAGSLEPALGATPGHHRGFLRQRAFEDLVPADQAPAVLCQELLQPRDDVALHFHLGAGAGLAHRLLHAGGGFPLILDRFIAADVHVRGREQFDHLGQHVLDELQRAFLGIEQVGEHAPLVVDGQRLLGAAQLRVGDDGRGGVAGHVQFRDHLDMALRGIGDDLADLLLGVIAAVATRLACARLNPGIAQRHPAAADLGELGVTLDLHAPALVIGQVPVEGVELVLGHRVEELADLVQALEMPRRIQHQPAPAEARCVLDGGRRHVPAVAGGQQLRGGDRAIEQPGLVACTHLDAGFGNGQRIAFGRHCRGGIEVEADPRIAGVAGQGQLRATILAQQGQELLGDGLRGRRGCRHPHGILQHEILAWLRLVIGRLRDQ